MARELTADQAIALLEACDPIALGAVLERAKCAAATAAVEAQRSYWCARCGRRKPDGSLYVGTGLCGECLSGPRPRREVPRA